MSDKAMDPLEKPLAPLRVNYANGVLLDEDDFKAEQAYNRGRLGRALAYLHGSGTVAGLNVLPKADNKHVLMVTSGLAIDRIGRLIEVDVPYCIRAEEWFERQSQTNPDQLVSSYNNSDTGDGNKAVVADLFVKFEVCKSGMTPAFGVGNVDATDAFTSARLRDSASFELVLRTMPENAKPLPTPPSEGIGEGVDQPMTFDKGLEELTKFKLQKAWHEGLLWNEVDGKINGGREHTPQQNGTELLIARIRFPATDNPMHYDTNGDIDIDNSLRVLSLSNFELFWLMNATRGS